MTQQDRNQRHILEQQESGPSATQGDRLTALKAAVERRIARQALFIEPGGPFEALDTYTAARDAEYLTYLAGKLDPRD